jgi:hypothetical protein
MVFMWLNKIWLNMYQFTICLGDYEYNIYKVFLCGGGGERDIILYCEKF